MADTSNTDDSNLTEYGKYLKSLNIPICTIPICVLEYNSIILKSILY
jgi:hypothetical protein